MITKIERSILLIRKAESLALHMQPERGFWLAFSGGKDSQCIYHLAKMAGVKFEAHYSLTTLDHPELVRFIRNQYPDAIWDRPKLPFVALCQRKRLLPTRRMRFCCSEMKESMGWENVGSVEIDPFCRQVLDYWFDYEYTWKDIKAADFVRLRGRIDIITGGFPCQPFSNAGKQRGKDDDRYLWPEMLRAIREVQPRWVVGENVRGLLTNAGGMVFEQVCADMEDLGYEVQPLLVPACAVDAPHRRDRVWIVARLAADTPRNGDSGTSSEAGATPRRPDGMKQRIK